MSKIRESILQGIHAGTLKPHSRGYYLVLHTLLWISCIITLIIGVLSVSLLFFELNSPEHLSMEWMMDSDILWLRFLPIFWAFGAIIALVLGYVLFSRTDRGYRISTVLILSILCGGSFIGGGLLYLSGMIHIGDREMRKFDPQYDAFRNRFQKTLPRPEDGQLLLRVRQHGGNTFIGKSLDGLDWKIILDCRNDDCEKRTSEIKFKGPPTLFLGKIRSENVFEASDVRLPPHTPGERRKFREEFMRSSLSGEVEKLDNK